MLFSLPSNPTPSDVSEALNYLLNNFGSNVSINSGTGSVNGPTGNISYLYQYLDIKYATSFDGSVGFSNVPTNAFYFGIRNANSSVESTNPSDYLWQQVTGGFGTTKFLYYATGGGRTITFQVASTSPGGAYVQDTGSAINLDIVTGVNAYNAALPTIYQWTTGSAPARPSTTSTYTFATASFTPPSGWYSSIPSDSTPGDTLWAISIPLIVLANVATALLDWTNTGYPIVQVSKNGSTGPAGSTGATGLSSITAYKVQTQSASPPATPSNTTGATAPSGWSLTAPTVSVGSVLYYTFGQYNGSSSTINGIPANQTQWGTPTAASVFQDIESDNWNGSVPPTYGTPSTYGSTGYYISRSTGNCYFNNGIFRGNITGATGTFSGDLNTSGQAKFYGQNNSSFNINVNGTAYNMYYSGFGITPVSSVATSSDVNVGFLGIAQGFSGAYNVGITGVGYTEGTVKGIGVVGQGNYLGGYFSATTYGIQIGSGTFLFNTTEIQVPPNNAGYFLRGDGVWASLGSIGGGTVTSVSGTGTVSGLTLSGTVTTTGSLTLGGSLTLTSSQIYSGLGLGAVGALYWNGSAISTEQTLTTYGGTNSGTATASAFTMNFLGSTSTGIAGAYIGTTGSGNTITFGVQTTSPSDIRLKEEVADIDVGLDFVKKLRPVSYKLKADPKHQKGYGFIADEVEPLVEKDTSLVYFEPDWQVGDQTGFKTIHYPSYVAVLTKAIQELSAEVEQLKLALNQKSS